MEYALRAQNDGMSEEFDVELNFEGDLAGDVLTNVRFGLRYADRRSEVSEPFRGALNFNPTGPTLSDIVAYRELSTGGNIFGVNVLENLDALLGGQDLLDPAFNIGQSVLAGIVIGNATGDALAASAVEETSTSAYIEGDFSLGSLFVNAGVRFVNTEQTSTGSGSAGGQLFPVSIDNDYSEVLPAINAKLETAPGVYLRASYSKALSRPSLQALSPRETFNYNTLTGSRGNPELDPFSVDQFDIGVEWYFQDEGLVALTYFDKQFSSLIGAETVLLEREVTGTAGGIGMETVSFTQPFNTGDASVNGYEITAQFSLFALQGNLSNFGVLFNYTGLDSRATVAALSGTQLQPFPNLSPSSYNAGAYYDDGVFDARLTYAWREGFLQDGLDPSGNFFFQDDFGQMDLTMNYAVSDSLNLQLQATNLLDEALRFRSSAERVPTRRIDLERRIVFGVRYVF